MEATKKTSELLKTLYGTAEDFTAQHENGDLKAVGLGGKYVKNGNGRLYFSENGDGTPWDFLAVHFDNLQSFLKMYFPEYFMIGEQSKQDNLYFFDDFRSISKKVIDIPFGEIVTIFKNHNLLSCWIETFPQKQTLINHIISILSQKDVNCIDLVGLDSDLLEHIESEFEFKTFIFEDESEEMPNEGYLICDNFDNTKGIVLIDGVICCVENYIKEIGDLEKQWNEECNQWVNEKERVTYGWTW